MDKDAIKEYLKKLAVEDKTKFLSVITYYILKTSIEEDEEMRKMADMVKSLTNVDLNELLDTALKSSIKSKPTLFQLGLGSIMVVSYIMSRKKGKGGSKHG